MASFGDGLLRALLIPLRLFLTNTFASEMPYNFNTNEPALSSYDFIVVGAGASGSVVASRLSETTAQVLLLEAGDSAPPETALPAASGISLIASEGVDWNHRTADLGSQNLQTGFINNSRHLFTGKVMGGSTSINAMIYSRGSPHDYDAWASVGNQGWDFDSVLPYFRKFENYRGYDPPFAGKYHGRGGYLSIEKKRHNPRLVRHLMEASIELGYPPIVVSMPNQIGFAPKNVNTKDGFRHSTSEAFLRPVVHRSNLHIRPNCLVLQILFNRQKRAVGVKYRCRGKVHFVRARKEVIVCAGAIKTPQLLMLSGIGPEQHLREMEIPVVAAVEGVGKNLQDHYGVTNIPIAAKQGTTSSQGETLLHDIDELVANRTGYMTTSGEEGTAFFNLNGGVRDWADTFLTFPGATFSDDAGLFSQTISGIRKKYFRSIYFPIVGTPDSFAISIYIARPKTTGWVLLRSKDLGDYPYINFNYFSHPDDMKFLVRGIQYSLNTLLGTRAMKEGAGARFMSEPIPGCQKHEFRSDEYWACYARAMVNSGWHSCGTCKMAPDSDPLGVVDPRLKLRGVSGVRVIDSSIMPQIVTGNIMSTCIMIGEKGADLIKEDWGYE